MLVTVTAFVESSSFWVDEFRSASCEKTCPFMQQRLRLGTDRIIVMDKGKGILDQEISTFNV